MTSPATPFRRVIVLAVFGLFACAAPEPSPVPSKAIEIARVSDDGSVFDVLTQHNNSQRTGASLHEATLTPKVLKEGGFERLFDWEVDGQIYTQPLYVAHLPYQGRLINLVVVATTNNSVYAFEAPAAESDVASSQRPLWHVRNDLLGNPLPYYYFPMEWGILGHNMKPLIGITATPVIDRARRTIYVTVKSGSGGFLGFNRQVSYRLFAIDLISGAIKKSVDIAASYPGPDGAMPTFKAKFHLQRASLLEANDRIYIGFGSHQDTPPFHGWLLAYDADDLRPIAAYCTTCGRTDADRGGPLSGMGGIWQGGGGPASDEYGNIYVITGNGTYVPETGDRAVSFIKLDKDLNVLGSWTPATYDCLNRTDADLGSAGPVFISNTSTLVGGGKEGILYALRPDALQGTNVGAGRPPGIKDPCYDVNDPTPDASGPGYWSIQASPQWEYRPFTKLISSIDRTFLSLGFHHIHGSPVHWNVRDGQVERSLLYVSAERDLLRAYAFDAHTGFVGASSPGHDPIATFQSKCLNAKKGMPGGFLTLSANGNKPESGIIWAAMPRRNEDAFTKVVPGILRAYKAYPDNGVDLEELWNSDNGSHVGDACQDTTLSGQFEVGLFAKFVPPTVAEGKVYLATFSHRLAVYGVKRAVPAALITLP